MQASGERGSSEKERLIRLQDNLPDAGNQSVSPPNAKGPRRSGGPFGSGDFAGARDLGRRASAPRRNRAGELVAAAAGRGGRRAAGRLAARGLAAAIPLQAGHQPLQQTHAAGLAAAVGFATAGRLAAAGGLAAASGRVIAAASGGASMVAAASGRVDMIAAAGRRGRRAAGRLAAARGRATAVAVTHHPIQQLERAGAGGGGCKQQTHGQQRRKEETGFHQWLLDPERHVAGNGRFRLPGAGPEPIWLFGDIAAPAGSMNRRTFHKDVYGCYRRATLANFTTSPIRREFLKWNSFPRIGCAGRNGCASASAPHLACGCRMRRSKWPARDFAL